MRKIAGGFDTILPQANLHIQICGNAQNAEDITQEVFVKVWRNLKKFDQNKASKHGFLALPKMPR